MGLAHKIQVEICATFDLWAKWNYKTIFAVYCNIFKSEDKSSHFMEDMKHMILGKMALWALTDYTR